MKHNNNVDNPEGVARRCRLPDEGFGPAWTSIKLADGVYRLTGGYDALAVELKDQAVIIGGGRDETRALALLAETKRLFPGKAIKTAVSLHGHVDHAMVLPTFVSEGLTIYCDDSNQYFLEQSLLQPRTLLTDAMTSGGLLISIEAGRAAELPGVVIGAVTAGPEGRIDVR